MCKITGICSWILAFLVVFSLFNSLGTEINGVYFLIRFLQSNNLLAFINHSFTPNFVCFYEKLTIFNFSYFFNLPNFIRNLILDEPLPYSTPPSRFNEYGLASNWFDLGGKALTPVILLLMLWFIVKILWLVKFGTEVFPVMMKQIADSIVWNGIIRAFQITFLPLMFGSLLQLGNISFDTTTQTLGFVFAILTLFILGVFIRCSMRLARSPYLKNREYQRKYGATFGDYFLDKEVDYLTVNFEIFVALKKSLQIVAIIFFVYPSLQISTFLITEFSQAFLLYTKRRFKDQKSGILINFMCLINFINTIIICAVFFIVGDSTSEGIVWIIIIISMVLYLANFILIISEQIAKRKEIIEFYRQVFYGLWVIILGISSCFCCVCIAGNKWYWSRKEKKDDDKRQSTELALI